jgi:hypothetical protein
MHDFGLPAPDHTAQAMRDELVELVQEIRDDWQLTFDDDSGAWIAVRRPKPSAMRVIAAKTVPQMRDKLRKIREEERGDQGGRIGDADTPPPDC